jgi:hypothetical protein
MNPKPRVGDLVRYDWAVPSASIDPLRSAYGIVVQVLEPPNYHSGIDYTLEILEPNGRKFMYDVFLKGNHPQIISANPNPPEVD